MSHLISVVGSVSLPKHSYLPEILSLACQSVMSGKLLRSQKSFSLTKTTDLWNRMSQNKNDGGLTIQALRMELADTGISSSIVSFISEWNACAGKTRSNNGCRKSVPLRSNVVLLEEF